MSFQRSFSKVWWGSDSQQLPPSLPLSSAAGSTGGFYYCSNFSQKAQKQLNAQRLQNNNNGSGYHSLDSGSFRSYVGNLSRIEEVDDDQNSSKLVWGKRDSPGSLRSQDSGFSDNDELHSSRSLSGRFSKHSSPNSKTTGSANSDSHSSASSPVIETPPTVIKRVGKSEFYSPLVSVSRRISFSGSSTAAESSDIAIAVDTSLKTAAEGTSSHQRLANGEQLKEEAVSAAKKLNFDDVKLNGGVGDTPPQRAQQQQSKRRCRTSRQPIKPLSPTKLRSLVENSNNTDEQGSDVESNDSVHHQDIENDVASDTIGELEYSAERNRSLTRLRVASTYNNETVYLGVVVTPKAKPYNNETVMFPDCGEIPSPSLEDTNNNTLKFGELATTLPLLNGAQHYLLSTSTPKGSPRASHTKIQMSFRHAVRKYDNPLLNGHAPDLEHWLHDLRSTSEHEVMSTLQTKSIAQEAFKNLTITTNTVAKLIRQLQQRAIYMQSDFERNERVLSSAQVATLNEAISGAVQLLENVSEFTKVLERRTLFFNDSRHDRKRYEENIEQIRIITKDTLYSLERQHYINLESLLDDVIVLKRYVLYSVHQVFEKMVRIIVQSVEHGQCDLMLRANINMIATLMNIDYEGFASLTDAFVQNEAVRALLIVCVGNKLSSVRALALRALATICCSSAAIVQLAACGGIDIVRDSVKMPGKERPGERKRGDIERREAVSLLTQITAAWHGPEHRIDGLKDCAEILVEGLTQLIASTSCAQTLLLCAAALNNLSRIEVTSHYSIMSNEAIFKLIEVVQSRGEQSPIFLYEQIVSMLHNMSLNKKCHSHLANGSIINFITSAYQTEFYKSYTSRQESDARRRTIKAILHTLTHLVHESNVGIELLEQHRVPAFFRQAMLIGGGGGGAGGEQWPLDSSHSRDISALARQLLQAQRQEQADAALATVATATATATAAATPTEATESLPQKAEATMTGSSAAGHERADKAVVGGRNFKFNLTRQESFV